jgi:hypothetical protein
LRKSENDEEGSDMDRGARGPPISFSRSIAILKKIG